MALPTAALVVFSLAHLCLSKVINHDWDIAWRTAAPDGFPRPVIAVNGQWPPPILEADLGDTVYVNVHNSLGNESTSIHFHGQFQRGTNDMDGVADVTQCPIPPGGSFQYVFKAEPAGTHWWHSHDRAQYPDGIRGVMIVRDREWERALGVDGEYAFSVSDWYHEQMPQIIHEYLDGDDFGGGNTKGMPLEASSLINDTQYLSLDIEPNKKYLLRIAGVCANLPHVISVEDHDMTIVAIDGAATVPTTAAAIILHCGQRYDIIIQGKADPTRNYAFRSYQAESKLQANGQLRYNASFGNPPVISGDPAAPIDDIILKPKDGKELLKPVDRTITLPVSYFGTANRRIRLGNGSYISPLVPTLYTALTTGPAALDPAVYGPGVNPYVIKTGQVVQIVVENDDDTAHPMHLHGYRFQVVARGPGSWNGDENALPAVPMVRDTTTTPPSGHLVLRILADNPGVWVFHCHMELHLAAGMMVTFIESPDLMQRIVRVPPAQLQICDEQGIRTKGNCAGNTGNLTDNSQCKSEQDYEDSYGALITTKTQSNTYQTGSAKRDVR